MREGADQTQFEAEAQQPSRIKAFASYVFKLIKIVSYVAIWLSILFAFINLETQGLSLLTNAFHFLPSALTVPISGLLLMLLGVVILIITSKIIMNYNYNSFFSFCALLGSSLLAIALINLTPAVVAYSIMAQYYSPIIAIVTSIAVHLLFSGFGGFVLRCIIRRAGAYIDNIRQARELDQALTMTQERGFEDTYQRAKRKIETDPQSTHQASIHKSASESAKWLAEQYQSKLISVHLMTQQFTNYVAQETKKHASETQQDKKYQDKLVIAQQGFNRVTQISLPDSSSGITPKILLQLVWMFIHDTKIITNPNDVLPRLINSLYDIQRNANDHAQRDDLICPDGVFHKLIESVSGYHAHCKLEVITLTTATLKLPCVVREETLEHLKTLDVQQRHTILKQIRDDDMSVKSISPCIISSVETTMWREFQSVFIRNHRTEAQSLLEFQTFVAAGAEYTTLTSEQLTELETGMLTQATPAIALLSSSRAATHDSTPQPPKSELQQQTCFRR